MNALDVLSLDDAKSYLKVDFEDDDGLITSLIKTAVARVEQETSYRLYNRIELVQTNKVSYTAFQFPLISSNVEDNTSQGAGYTIRANYGALRTELFWGNGFGYINDYNQYFYNTDFYNLSGCDNVVYSLSLNVGYIDTSLIPQDLITAVQQLVSSLYETRYISGWVMPNNIMMLIAPYKRFVTLY